MNEMPKIGETVTVQFTGTVTHHFTDGDIRIDGDFISNDRFAYISPACIVQPRPAWVILRDAAKILGSGQEWDLVRTALYEEADYLEEAAKPKLTLAEAVRAYVGDNPGDCSKYSPEFRAVVEALEREEAAKNG